MKALIFSIFVVVSYVYGYYHPQGSDLQLIAAFTLFAKIWFVALSIIMWLMFFFIGYNVNRLTYKINAQNSSDKNSLSQKFFIHLSIWLLRGFTVFLFYIGDWPYFAIVMSYVLSTFLLQKLVAAMVKEHKAKRLSKIKK